MPGMDLGLTGRACIVTGASSGHRRRHGARAVRRGRARPARRARRAERARDGRRRRRARPAGAPRRSPPTSPTRTPAERVVAACAERFGETYALVNSAGTSAIRRLDELTDADWQAQWELHVMAPMRLMRAAAPRMAERGGGRIVNVCSSSGKRPSHARTPPTRSPRRRSCRCRACSPTSTRASGVLVNAVAPGTGRDAAVDRARRHGRPGGRAPGRSTARRRSPTRASGSRSAAWASPRRSRR